MRFPLNDSWFWNYCIMLVFFCMLLFLAITLVRILREATTTIKEQRHIIAEFLNIVNERTPDGDPPATRMYDPSWQPTAQLHIVPRTYQFRGLKHSYPEVPEDAGDSCAW
jgi:hypothetical protein